MKIKYAKLNVEQTCGDMFMLTEVVPVYNYVDGKRSGDPVAHNYTVVLPQRKFEQLKVRIDGVCALKAPEEPTKVQFENLILEIRWSQNDGNYIAATATGIAAVD